MIFVSLGTQRFPFYRLLQQLEILVQNNLINEEVICQIGNTKFNSECITCFDFLEKEDFNKYLDLCDLVICHGGAGTITAALKKGKKVIVVPRLSEYGEHVDDHQLELTQSFSKSGYIEYCQDINELHDLIALAKIKSYPTFFSNTENIENIIFQYIKKEDMKKVLIINTVEFEYNGITKVILNMISNMGKDFLLDVIACDKIDPSLKNKVQNDINNFYDFGFRKKGLLKYIYALYKLIKSNNYDVVHIHGNSATMAFESIIAKICGVKKIIAHCHNNSTNHPVVNQLLKPILKLTITDAVACSNLAGDWLYGKYPYIVFKNGIDTNQYKFNINIRQEMRSQFGLENSIVLGHIGLFNEQKNQVFLLDVLDQLLKNSAGYKLLLVGHGLMKNQFIDIVNSRKLSDKVIILENRSDIPKLLMAMDYFLFPSKWEGFGIALLEAQASGLPCIVSDKVSRDVNVTDHVKYVSLDNKSSWINQIHNIINSREYHSLDNIKKIINKGYDMKKSIIEIIKIYESS